MALLPSSRTPRLVLSVLCATVLCSVTAAAAESPAGRAQYLPERIFGPTSRDFDATAVIRDFFSTHGRKRKDPL